MGSLLADIQLTEAQQSALKEKLDAWKLNEKKKLETELTEKYEIMEANLKDEYEDLVSNVKENMQKVYTKRFVKALKEMHSEIKAQVMYEQLDSPEVKALDEMKAIIYPLINESNAKRYRDEFNKLADMYTEAVEDLDKLRGEVKKAKLVESLSPEVRKVVTKLLGEGTEEEIVEKFATIKQALKEDAAPAPSTPRLNEDVEDEDDFDYDEDEDEDEDDDEEEVTVRRSVEEEDEEEDMDESVNSDFEKMLNEQLILAGLKKSR
jgi:hypothetical protein